MNGRANFALVLLPNAYWFRRDGEFSVQAFQEKRPFCRRQSSRFATPDGVWVYWRCDGKEDVSRVDDMSVGGMFLATPIARPQGVKAQIDFLVQEGQIRTEAIVSREEAPRGLGLKFIAVNGEDRQRLALLLTRMRSHRAAARKKTHRTI